MWLFNVSNKTSAWDAANQLTQRTGWLFNVSNQTSAWDAPNQLTQRTGWLFNWTQNSGVVAKTAEVAVKANSTALVEYGKYSVNLADQNVVVQNPRTVLENLSKISNILNVFSKAVSNSGVDETSKVVTEPAVSQSIGNPIVNFGSSILETIKDTSYAAWNVTSTAASSHPYASAILTTGLAYGLYARSCEKGRRAELNKKIEELESKLNTTLERIQKLENRILKAKESSDAAG